MSIVNARRLCAVLSVAGVAATAGTLSLGARDANAFAYIFAGEGLGVNIVTHAKGYTGAGGMITVSVGIDPTSSFAAQMLIPTQNVVNTWNGKLPTTGNLIPGGIGAGQVDFESVLLHEVGHAIGLAHTNAASESGLAGAAQNYTRATDGANNVFNVNPGPDGIIGSADDIRGDDVNLNYFRIADNNPFATNLGIVDSTTYSRDIANLPAGDSYSANPDRAVAAALGFLDTEAVMQQGSFTGEIQRTLGADDVAGLLYAQAGIDGIFGTADDYILTLDFLGLTATADIIIDFDNNETGFAESQSTGGFIGVNDIAITGSQIFFNSNQSWFFNQVSNETTVAAVSAPGGAVLLALGLAALARRRRAV